MYDRTQGRSRFISRKLLHCRKSGFRKMCSLQGFWSGFLSYYFKGTGQKLRKTFSCQMFLLKTVYPESQNLFSFYSPKSQFLFTPFSPKSRFLFGYISPKSRFLFRYISPKSQNLFQRQKKNNSVNKLQIAIFPGSRFSSPRIFVFEYGREFGVMKSCLSSGMHQGSGYAGKDSGIILKCVP